MALRQSYYCPSTSDVILINVGVNLPSYNYRKSSSMSRTESQYLIVSCVIMQLSLLNPLKPGVKSRMKM